MVWHDIHNHAIQRFLKTFSSVLNSLSRRAAPPNSLILENEHRDDIIGVNTRLGLPLCDNINTIRPNLRTPLLEDDRESCV